MVAFPSSVMTIELGVFMYHWPFAGPLELELGPNSGSSGVTASGWRRWSTTANCTAGSARSLASAASTFTP